MENIAVITPYYKEPDEQLLQCHNSVLAQSYPCTHILVADGFPKHIATPNRTLHVPLPMSNADYGNMPRFIGGVLAESYGFDAVAYLDADNWFEPDHLEKMLVAQRETGAALVSCKRTFRDLEGQVLPVTEIEEDSFSHVDTNCWLIARPAFGLFKYWRAPKQVSIVVDRIFFQAAQRERYKITETHHRTVNYRTKYPDHYIKAGVALPPGVYQTDGLSEAQKYALSLEGVKRLTDMLGFYPSLA